MDALPYLLPWLLLLLAAGLAVAVKMLPLKSIPGIATLSVLSLLFLGVCIYANIISAQQTHRLHEKTLALEQMENWKYRHLDELSLLIAQLKPPASEDLALLKRLQGYGWITTRPSLRQMQEAEDARERTLAQYTPSQPMLFKGTPLSVDEKIVDLSLRQVGFTVLPWRDDETREADVNILYYGRDMQLLEIKLAAFTLLRAGIELKGIKPFPQPTSGNLRAIKIEWNKHFEIRRPLTVAEIEAAQSFK